ncbi:MAG: hypothetical protein ACRCWW_07675 [Scandinavium sp.]|uniref:hypothetical protein n=1 Tax=Scandinavium sp. TaxID=2830653 RepID=UPI003F3A3769
MATATRNNNELIGALAATSAPAPFDPSPAAPSIVNIDYINDDVGENTGHIAEDGLTDDLRPTLSGHAEGAEGMELKVWFNTELAGYAVVDQNGN